MRNDIVGINAALYTVPGGITVVGRSCRSSRNII